jgi:nucleoside-diphosphate-sugar epimerase
MSRVPTTAFPVLMTGASGLLGSRILRELLAQSDDGIVYVAGRRVPAPAPRIRHWPLDLGADALVLPGDVRTVLHVAGEKRDPAQMEAVNHRGTLRLLRACAPDLKLFVHMSSVGVYGAPHNAGPVTEAFRQTPRNAYEASKARGEQAVAAHFAQGTTRWVVLRPSNVIDAGSLSAPPLLRFIRSVHAGHFVWPGEGRGILNYVSVANVGAAALRVVAVRGADGAYNVNTPVPLAELVVALCDALGVRLPRWRLPDWVFEGLGHAGDLLHNVGLRSLPVNTGRMRELRNSTLYVPDRLVASYDFSYPTRLVDEVQAMARLYRQEGLL